MNRLLVGVVGHVDHGKTALVSALTGMDTDRLQEEKRRGISIVLGFAYLDSDGTQVDLIDMPGHERFVRTMVSGATGLDAILLVVAANEGVKPQTREHVDIAALLGVSRAVVVITKIDLASTVQSATVGDAVMALLADRGLSAARPIFTAAGAAKGVADADSGPSGLAELRHQLAGLARKGAAPPDDGFPYLPIDRSFSLPGLGLVVTGTLRRGALNADDDLVALPGETPIRVRGLQVHGRPVAAAEPGQRVAVNLRGLGVDEIPPGLVLTRARQLVVSDWLSVELQSLLGGPALRTGVRLILLIGACEVPVRVRLLDRDELAPGDTALAQLHCGRPISAPARDPFILRIPSPPLTLAGGRVLDPGAHRLRRYEPAVLDRLQRLCRADPRDILIGELTRAAAAGATLIGIARLAGLSSSRAAALLADLGVVHAGETVVDPAAFAGLCVELAKRIAEKADVQPNGVPASRIGALLPHASSAAVEAALAHLTAAGKLRRQGASVRVAPSRAEEVGRARQDEVDLATLAEAFRRGGLTPPDTPAIATTPTSRRLLDRLLRDGVVVKTLDRVQGRELLFHREAISLAKQKLAAQLTPPGLLVKDAGAVLGISRKFSVPLLEYLDALQFTRRQGDRRVIGRHGEV